MNNQQIKEYFETYVKNYKPYRHIPEYSNLIDTLITYYTDHSYTKINSPFKTAYEEQIIPKEFYNNLLLSIGYPENLIAKFTEKDKIVLLSSFMDFNRYKGTIDQFQKIGNSFDEPLSIYELFIDYRELDIFYYEITPIKNNNVIFLENQIIFDSLREYDKIILDDIEYEIKRKVFDNGKYFVIVDKPYNGIESKYVNFKINRWVFIPKCIYNYKNNKIIDTYFPYIDVYLGTYHYFVNIEELETSRISNNIILPIKSNLIFIDYNRYKEINILNNLLATIFLKEYYDKRLTIFFKDGDYSTTLGRLYKLWYYILIKFYNYDFVDVDISNFVMFDKDHYGFDYNITDVNFILEQYNKIETAHDYSQFYYEFISSKLTVPEHLEKTIPLEDFEFIVRNEIGKELIDYVNDRVQSSSSEIKKYEYNFLLDEIYNSIITWVMLSNDSSIQNNYEYLLNNMSRISYSIDMSPSYNLINYVKPYHVEIISELTEYLKSDGKGNIVNTDMLFEIYLKMAQATTYTISEKLLYCISIPDYNNVNINTSMNFNITDLINTFVTVFTDYVQIKIKYMSENNISVSTLKFINDIESHYKSIISVIQNINHNIIFDNKLLISILYKTNNLLEYVNEINITTNTINANYNLFSMMTSVLNVISEFQSEILFNYIQTINISKFYYIDVVKFNEINLNINSIKFINTINYTTYQNININHFYQFLDHTNTYLMTIISLVDIFINYRIKIFQQFNTYQDIIINSDISVFCIDDDTSLIIDSLPEITIYLADYNVSGFVFNIMDFNLVFNDSDTSGIIDITPELNMHVHKLNNLIVSHTFNLI